MRGTLALGGGVVVLSCLVAAGPAPDAGPRGGAMKGAAYLHAEGSSEVKFTPVADDAVSGLGS